MEIEVAYNELFGDWWYAIGIDLHKSVLEPEGGWELTISLVFFSIYFRRKENGKKQKTL